MSSRVISSIFNAKEPEFSHRIFELERLSGKNSHDVRVTSEIIHHFKDLSKRLDLDPHDTTPNELYRALLIRSTNDSKKLASKLGITKDMAPNRVAEKCASYLERRTNWRKFWCLKQSVIKKQLKANPPKNVMKILGFRSIDSLLKREPIVQTLILAKILEGSGWQKKYAEQASSITASDFDEQQVTIDIIKPIRLASLRKSGVNLNRIVYSSEESSSIIIAPALKRFEGDVLFYFDTIINHVNGIINRSAFYRYKSPRPDFFKTLKDIRAQGFKKSSFVSWPIRWSAVVHSIQHYGNLSLVERLDLNIPPHDLFGMTTTREMQHFGIWEKGLVYSDRNNPILSTNISDIIVNAINKNLLEHSYNEFGKNRLYDELFSRYLLHEPVLDDIFKEEDL